MSALTRDGTAEPVSRGEILKRDRRQEIINFPCSADHEQNCQSIPVCLMRSLVDVMIIHRSLFFVFPVSLTSLIISKHVS